MDEFLEAATAARIVLDAVPEQPGAVLYADRAVRGPGPVPLGADQRDISERCVLAFRDDMPGANWMHPCAYVLVSVATRSIVATVESDRPPTFGRLPDSWTVVSDPEGRADLIHTVPTSPS
jgi:hypothetical protein